MGVVLASDMRWLQKRGRTFYAVREVPRSLRRKLGKRRLVASLKTDDLRIAHARRHEALAGFQRIIDAAAKASTPDPTIAAAMAWRRLLDGIKRGDPAYVKPGKSREQALEEADMVLDSDMMDIRVGDGEEAAGAFLGIAYGVATPLLHHVDAWLAEGGAHGPLNLRTQAMYRADLRRLEAWGKAQGIPQTVEAITREVAGRYVGSLIAAGINRKTANRRISAPSAYWRWLGKRAGIVDNPWTGQSLATAPARLGHDKDKRPYTDAELVTLLAGPADRETADAMRLAALSGMRLEELYRLTVADCYGGWFNIRQAKTAAGVRRVPIHPELAGLVARRSEGKAPEAFLMSEAGALKPGRERSASFSKRYGHYRRKLGIEDRAEGRRHSRIDFHSLRRWFVTRARQAGIDRAVVAAVVGHEVGNLTDDTYSGGPSEAQLRACVEAVRLPWAADRHETARS